MNTLTHTQMTTERFALGLSLPVRPWRFAPGSFSVDAHLPTKQSLAFQATRHLAHGKPNRGRYQGEPANHIRGGNPWPEGTLLTG